MTPCLPLKYDPDLITLEQLDAMSDEEFIRLFPGAPAGFAIIKAMIAQPYPPAPLADKETA